MKPLHRIHRRSLASLVAGVAFVLAGASSPASAIPPMPTPPPAAGEESPAVAPPPAGLGSPRATLQTLFRAVPPSGSVQLDTATDCFAKSSLPPTEAVRRQSIASFVQTLDWLGWRDPAILDEAPAEVQASEPGTFQLLPYTGPGQDATAVRSGLLLDKLDVEPRIVIRRGQDGAWRFGESALAPDVLDAAKVAVRNLRRENGEEPAPGGGLEGWITASGPEWLSQRIAFIEIWQWIGLGIVVLLGLSLDLVARLVSLAALRRLVRRIHENTEDVTVRRAVRGIGLVASTSTWLFLLPFLDLPLVAFGVLQPATRLAFVLALFWCGWRAIDLAGEVALGRAHRSETKADDILVPMFRKTLKVILVAFVLLNLAPLLGLELGPLIAAIGVGSFGFAFAFKNSLENLFGSVTVILDRPFQVGDWVVVEGVEGTVEAVGLRSTRIRTFYNSLVSLPNSNLITTKVDNYGLRKYRRWKTEIGVLYGTPVPRIEAFCAGIRELVREHPYTRKDYYQVWVNEFGASGINILVYVFWQAPDWQTELRERHRFMVDIMRLADAVGVEFAYPSQTIYLERAGARAKPLDASLDAATDQRTAMRAGRNAVRELTKDALWRTQEIPKYRFLDAEETARIDSIADEGHAAAVESRIEKQERSDLPAEAGDDPEKPDFTEQRDAGG